MSNKVKAVLFDFGGVLAEEGFREGLKAIAEKNQLDPEIFYATADSLIFESGYLTGMNEESRYWNLLRERTGITGTDRELREEILKRFVPRPALIAYTDILRARALTVALLSDQTNWLEELDRTMLLFKHFDRIFNSFTYHKSKRDPSIFPEVCSHLGIKTGEALFIDDNIDHIGRAKSAGLHTIHYTTYEDFERRLCAFLMPVSGAKLMEA